jgi:hypothetical protein
LVDFRLQFFWVVEKGGDRELRDCWSRERERFYLTFDFRGNSFSTLKEFKVYQATKSPLASMGDVELGNANASDNAKVMETLRKLNVMQAAKENRAELDK